MAGNVNSVVGCMVKIEANAMFHFHVTVHRDKFFIIKPTRCTNFPNLFLE